MQESSRKNKQFIIALIFFLVFGGLGYLIYLGVKPDRPVISVDPTLNLAPIQVNFTKLLNIRNNDYDFLARVSNPNVDFGSSNVSYELRFFNSANAQIATISGSFYILPGQTKYVASSPLKFNEPISRVEMDLISVDWQKLSALAASGATLLVRSASYLPVFDGTAFAKVGGEVLNNSDLDIGRVDVVVAVLDKDGSPLAVNKTQINTFLSKTTRGFEVTWFSPFVGEVSRVDAEANANVFENSNFLRQYGEPERFKQLY